MSDQGVWFKLWIGADEDPVLGDFSLEDFGRWCKFGLYLKKHGTGGVVELKPPCLALQNKFKVASFYDVLTVLQMFPNCSVTGETNVIVTWKNWSKYQGDNSTSRVRKWRENVTAKKRREEKREEEKRYKIPQTRKNKTAWPENLSLGDGLRTWALGLHCADPDAQFEAFRDYHQSHGSRFTDWDAAFRTWIRNSFKFAGRPAPTANDASARIQRSLLRGL